MLDPTEALSPFQLRLASMDDFSFAEALTRNNMNGYYRRHNLVWRAIFSWVAGASRKTSCSSATARPLA
jgi:hypothetical protein